jgi:hypothetical protein
VKKKLELSKLSSSNLEDLKEFIAKAKSGADKFKGLTIADDDEIAEVSKNIKELNTDQDTLEEARDILMENAGINIVVEAASYIRGIRLDLNRDLTEAKSRIKEGAINLFIAHLHTLIDAEKDASEGFKNSFNGKEREIALDTIKGKSKNFKKLMNEKLQEIKYDLARNGKQTKEQKLVISKFPKEITYDEEHLLSMSKENIKIVLEKRANDIIEREKQVAEEAKEQERVRMLQAQKQEQERIDREKMRKDNEALAQREKPVETLVKERETESILKNGFCGGVIEAEAVEIEGFVVDFEGTIENAKNVARYAKEVVGAKGVTLTKK